MPRAFDILLSSELFGDHAMNLVNVFDHIKRGEKLTAIIVSAATSAVIAVSIAVTVLIIRHRLNKSDRSHVALHVFKADIGKIAENEFRHIGASAITQKNDGSAVRDSVYRSLQGLLLSDENGIDEKDANAHKRDSKETKGAADRGCRHRPKYRKSAPKKRKNSENR